MHLRYDGTDSALEIDLGSISEMTAAFEEAHRKQFGFTSPGKTIIAEALAVESAGGGAKAEEQDHEVDTDLLQAREAGPTIVEEAVEQGADLILMGVKYKRRFGQFSLGSAVPYVLKNAPCRVILYHQPT